MDPRLCACGSGLRRARCCEPTPVLSPRAHPSVEGAQKAFHAGDLAAAEALCHEILEQSPTQQDALAVLHGICAAQGRHAAAEALVRRLVLLNPNNAPATLDLARRLMNRGDLEAAEIHARNAIRIAANTPQAHNLLGMILTEAGRPRRGEFHYRRVQALMARPDPILLVNLARNLTDQGRIPEAGTCYEQLAALAPDLLAGCLGWARLKLAAGDFAGCGRLLDRAEGLAPDNPSVALVRAMLQERMGETQQALARLATGGGALDRHELREKGRLLDRLGHYGEAFALFVEARRQNPAGQPRVEPLAAGLRGFFVPARLETLPPVSTRTDMAQPIFLLGFGGSGTAMVERLLSAHPGIGAGGEVPSIAELAASIPRRLNSPLPYPEALCEVWFADHRHALDEFRDLHLEGVRRLGVLAEGAAWFTDRMALNEIHLGLIGLLFPHAPIIHVLRHPLDVILSVLSQRPPHPDLDFGDLETLARHYLVTMELVAHTRSEMLLRYLPVRHEDILDHQDASVRRMLEFCSARGVPHRGADPGAPLRAKNSRYRNYMTELAPVIPLLEPMIARLGYEI